MGPRRHRRQALHPAGAPRETVKSQEEGGRSLRRYAINGEKKVLCEGRAIGQKLGQGKVRLVKDASEMDTVKAGDILVTDMTDRLGAGDEARFGNCDQPRRPHLPRRHYCA